MTYVYERGNRYHFRRRVPTKYRNLHAGPYIQVPLDTDSETVATQRAGTFNEVLEKHWLEKARGEKSSYEILVKEARSIGFRYRPISELLSPSDLPELLSRINIASQSEDKNVVDLVLGTVPEKPLRLDAALSSYLDHEVAEIAGKSEEQVRHWRNGRIRAVRRFKEVVTDIPVQEIGKKTLLQYRAWWAKKIAAGEINADTANKQIIALRDILRVTATNNELEIDFDHMFQRMLFKTSVSARLPFTTNYIKEVLFDRDSLQLNEECQLFIYAMADTGARVSELVGLDSEAGDVVLGTDIPHIKIRPNNHRNLKTIQSERELPLVGSSHFAFKELGGGFSRYLGKNTLISNTINKYLRGRLPSENHSLYSLRHSYEDRLTAVEPPEKVQAAIMGHKYSRPRYGLGPSLEQKKEWMEKVALL